VLAELGIPRVDGVLLDLGVSSHQLDTPSRGFRFGAETAAETPLDMRMDSGAGPDAAELLREASAEQLEDWLRRYADLPGARRLARALVAARERAPLRTAADLLRVIREARIGGGRRHNPATLVFQALRIATNDELGALAAGLDAAIDALRPGGRLVVIAYHSAEDRIVKNGLRDAARGCTCPPHVPVCVCGGRVRLRVLTRRPVSASPTEVANNPRSRSARLRAAERVAEAA
jgi:16S rRNA (cytosine1402-N4)-methyltransferase